MFVRGQDGAGSPGANSRELESGPSAEVPLVAESGRALAVFPLDFAMIAETIPFTVMLDPSSAPA